MLEELCFELVEWLGEHSEAQAPHVGNLLHCFARLHSAFVRSVDSKASPFMPATPTLVLTMGSESVLLRSACSPPSGVK